MAGTRIKQCLGNYTADQKQVSKHEAWRLNTTAWISDRPAFPVGLNAPHYPASLLANNYIDIETALRGIGSVSAGCAYIPRDRAAILIVCDILGRRIHLA